MPVKPGLYPDVCVYVMGNDLCMQEDGEEERGSGEMEAGLQMDTGAVDVAGKDVLDGLEYGLLSAVISLTGELFFTAPVFCTELWFCCC